MKTKKNSFSSEYMHMVKTTVQLIDMHCLWLQDFPMELILRDQVQRQLMNLLIILKPAIHDLYDPEFKISLKKVLKYEQLYDLLEVREDDAVMVLDKAFNCFECTKSAK